MTNNIGGLLKEFVKNKYIHTHILEGMDWNACNNDIAEMIMYDDFIMPILKTYVDDESIIIDKLKVFIGQQVKKISSTLKKNKVSNVSIVVKVQNMKLQKNIYSHLMMLMKNNLL